MSNSTEAVVVGDLHLGALGNIFPDFDDPDMLIYRAVNIALTYARDNGITNLIFLGDIFDTPNPDQRVVMRFLIFLLSLREYQNVKFTVYVIPGNHDYEAIGTTSLETTELFTKIALSDYVHLYMQPEHTLIDGVPFCFMPWPHMSKKKAGLPATPTINIAHIEQAGAIRDSGMKSPDGHKLFIGNNFWIIGHLHRYQKSNHVWYPGTLFQKNFGEPLPKGFLHAKASYVKGNLTLTAKFIPVEPPFILENLRIETPADLAKVKPYDIDHFPLHRYKLFVKKDVALPPNYRANNPHIVKLDGWREKAEAEALEQGQVALLQMQKLEVHELIFRDLGSVLKKHKLTKPERSRARHIVSNIISKLGVSQ